MHEPNTRESEKDEPVENETGKNRPEPAAPSSLPGDHGRSAPASRIFYGPAGLRAGWRMLIFLAICLALFSVAGTLLRLAGYGASLRGGLNPVAVLLSEGIPLLLVFVAAWAMAKIENGSFATYGLPVQAALGARFWQGAVLGFAAISLLLGSMRLAGAFHVTGAALHGTQGWEYASLWAVVFVVVALFEEFFFRGYALFTLTTGIGFWPAAAVLSCAFGYVHHRNPGENWVGAFAAGLVGLLFCLLLRRSGNLWMPIGFHAAWDWGETYFYGVPDSGQMATGHLFNATFSGPEWLTGGTVGPEGSYFCIALLLLLCALFAVWLREPKYPAPAAIAALRPPKTYITAVQSSGRSEGPEAELNPMLGSSKLIAFAPAKDLKRARKFYEKVLGLRFVSEDAFALVFDAAGIMLRVASVPDFQPAPFTILGWQVSAIEASVRELKERGVSFERYDFMPQDELGIWASPSGAKVAWFKDPDGNVLSLTQLDAANRAPKT